MKYVRVVGIDPGIVHTGVVEMVFDTRLCCLDVYHEAIVGPDAQATKDWINRDRGWTQTAVFIEGYRPRSNYGHDSTMVAAVQEFKHAISHAKVINNTGVKKIVRQPLMELLGVWKFATVTHHQDLRSAARIAILGMLKEDDTNLLITNVVSDHLEGSDWNVSVHSG